MSNKQSPLIFKHIEDSRRNMIQFMADIIRVPAIGPMTEEQRNTRITILIVCVNLPSVRHFTP